MHSGREMKRFEVRYYSCFGTGLQQSTRPRRSARRATTLEFFPLRMGKRKESEVFMFFQKPDGQPVKGKVHDVHLVPPREAMDLRAGAI